ncbi:hypothetical protein GA0115250_11494, partial [Streptomyces sp. BvitLS-983]
MPVPHVSGPDPAALLPGPPPARGAGTRRAGTGNRLRGRQGPTRPPRGPHRTPRGL